MGRCLVAVTLASMAWAGDHPADDTDEVRVPRRPPPGQPACGDATNA